MKPTDVIKKDYIRNFLILILVVFLLGTVLSVSTLYLDIYRPLNTHYSDILSVIDEMKDSLITKTAKIGVIFYLLIAAGIGMLVIFYTHRVAGPLHRIKQHAKSIGEGALSAEIKFRQRDAVNSLAESLNDLTGNYGAKVSMLSSDIEQLKSHVTELKSLTERGANTQEAAQKIVDVDNKIRKFLNTIKL